METEIGGSRKIEEYVASEYRDEMLKLFEVLDVRFRESKDISIIKETLMNIERSDGHKVDISDIDDKYEAVFESISSGLSGYEILDTGDEYENHLSCRRVLLGGTEVL